MSDILKISLILLVIILLLKKGWNIGIVMAISSVILSILYRFSPFRFIDALTNALLDPVTIRLILALTLIRVFENIMRRSGVMQIMMESFKGMVKDRRVIMASMPAIIGLLPSMGGALFSAPMVEEVARDADISSEQKAFINYTFRHPWEFILPLYPGIVLASAITDYPLRALIIANLPYSIALIAGGIIWGLMGMKKGDSGSKDITMKGLMSFLPLVLILMLVILFHLDLSVSIGVTIICLFIVLKYRPKEIIHTIRQGLSWEIFIIIIGVMTFKAVMESSGAVGNIGTFFSDEGIPPLPVVFILPFISGLLTGLTVGFVGSTFPIIIGLNAPHHIMVISFAFASGYAGVFLSPVHLCLVLTKEYFKADTSGLYHRIIKVSILIIAVAILELAISL
ncbi:MAG: DUF401 family protein [Thermodesulfovibrionia bacterium]